MNGQKPILPRSLSNQPQGGPAQTPVSMGEAASRGGRIISLPPGNFRPETGPGSPSRPIRKTLPATTCPAAWQDPDNMGLIMSITIPAKKMLVLDKVAVYCTDEMAVGNFEAELRCEGKLNRLAGFEVPFNPPKCCPWPYQLVVYGKQTLYLFGHILARGYVSGEYSAEMIGWMVPAEMSEQARWLR